MGSIAFQLLVPQSFQAIEESLVRCISNNLETFPVSPNNLAGKASVVGAIRFQAVELLIFEPNLHASWASQALRYHKLHKV